MEDPPEKVGFIDGHWLRVSGGHAAAEVGDEAVYLAMAVRNVGNGLAVLHGWSFTPGRLVSDDDPVPPSEFRCSTRDLDVAAGDTGFWQGAFRDPDEPLFKMAAQAIDDREPMTVDLLYGDHEGGQRVVSRFGILPVSDSSWVASIGRHWHLDHSEPR